MRAMIIPIIAMIIPIIVLTVLISLFLTICSTKTKRIGNCTPEFLQKEKKENVIGVSSVKSNDSGHSNIIIGEYSPDMKLKIGNTYNGAYVGYSSNYKSKETK